VAEDETKTCILFLVFFPALMKLAVLRILVVRPPNQYIKEKKNQVLLLWLTLGVLGKRKIYSLAGWVGLWGEIQNGVWWE
jgi:hypothetical protein